MNSKTKRITVIGMLCAITYVTMVVGRIPIILFLKYDPSDVIVAFIDGLVERKDSMTALWVKGDGFPKTEDNKAKNELLAALTPEQKGVLAEMLQDEHIAGIHDTLAYINEMMDLEGLELHQDGESYPNDYFESLHYDFISRCDGDEWPE